VLSTCCKGDVDSGAVDVAAGRVVSGIDGSDCVEAACEVVDSDVKECDTKEVDISAGQESKDVFPTKACVFSSDDDIEFVSMEAISPTIQYSQ
jgi:hypothetical protein